MVAAIAEQYPDLFRTYADVLRPLPARSPAVFAEQERVLHSIYCSERPGRWDNATFPYQPHVINTAEEAMRTGKRGVVIMKGGQIGGTDAAINMMLWLKVYYPGPQLFMTATEKVAQEFGRERFESIIRDMPSLRGKYLPNPRGDILTKRFIDGKIQLSGGQSVFNLQSTPYRVVVIDELDSLSENLGGQGDPLKLAEVRTDSFSGPTLIIAYAHPSTPDRGAGKLFYQSSDQRRGFIQHDCGGSFYLQWEHVKCVGNAADAGAYVYVCPQCGAEISNAERVLMLRNIQYRSVLDEATANQKAWIGLHANQLYSPFKTIRSLAQRWVECGQDENAKRVFYNKIMGEPYEPKVQKIDADRLRVLVAVKRRPNDAEFYSRGQVPAGVRFLTAGQDSRTTELHYAVWGWGLRRAVDKTVSLCGWLVDWGCIKRPYSLTFSDSEYHVFDDLMYNRTFHAAYGNRTFNVMQGGHDVGYQPTQMPLFRFCRSWPRRAIPVKGSNVDATSASTAPYARWGTAMKFRAGETELQDEIQTLLLNTYMLKTDWYGWVDARIEIPDMVGNEIVGTRKVGRISFPEDVEDEYIEQSKNEALATGKKSGELVWVHTGPNHYADCNTYALGLAYNLDPFQQNLTAEEFREKRQAIRPAPVAASNQTFEDPSMG